MTNAAQRFRELHTAGTFVLPNPWDAGSARVLAALGFEALATTSSGFAASLGRADGSVTREELLSHVRSIVGAVRVPVSVDAENGYAADPAGVAGTVAALAAAGAAGCSIEDAVRGPGPDDVSIYPVETAAERVAAAAEAASARDLVLTARAENHLYGIDQLDDTIARLTAYRDAGADVLYAPGLANLDDIARVVKAVGVPVNVLALPHGPSIPKLASVGVRRVSVGGALAKAAYSALIRGAQELLESGTSEYTQRGRSQPDPFSLL